MSVRINLEIGHEASIRTKRTPEGFTHDWEVFVRGCDGAEIQYYVEKVVFHLHETFSKPRRVIKEPPYTVKESGYAGFNFPIEIYLRNKDEPKKIRFNYDLHLQPSGPAIIKVQKEKYVFNSPSEEFKHKLLKGGGIAVVPSNSQENVESNRSSSETKNELINKPKLGGSDITKKHKMKLDEPRVPNSFQDLFGTPITKMTKMSELKPISKDVNKTNSGKLDKDKDKNKEKSKYSPSKEKEKEKDKQKEKSESDRKKEEKRSKDRSRERGHSKETSSKREKSPKPRSPSPKRSPKRISSPKRPPSPPPIKHKEEKRIESSKEKDRKDRPPDEKLEKKLKKDKRDREHKETKHKDKDSQKPSEYKEHRKEQKPTKELVREKELSPSLVKTERKDKPKEKESPKDTSKDNNEISTEKLDKIKNDKIEEKQKHKHKKKDKEKKDKEKSHKDRIKEKEKQATPKYPEIPKETREDKANLFSSPKNEEKVKKPVPTLFSEGEMDSSNSSISSKEDSLTETPEKFEQKKESLFEAKKPKPEFDKTKPKKEKLKKTKEKKSDKEEKKRKRKSERMEEEPVEKIPKEDTPNLKAESSDSEHNSNTSQSVEVDKQNQEDPEDYMQVLRDLQHKIMTLQDNSELQKVVQLIAETGRYEVSARTFDFDLCLLEKSTVRQLQEFFASSS